MPGAGVFNISGSTIAMKGAWPQRDEEKKKKKKTVGVFVELRTYARVFCLLLCRPRPNKRATCIRDV